MPLGEGQELGRTRQWPFQNRLHKNLGRLIVVINDVVVNHIRRGIRGAIQCKDTDLSRAKPELLVATSKAHATLYLDTEIAYMKAARLVN